MDKYLLPLEKDPEEEKKIQGELIELRNTTCLFFFLINGLFVVLVFTLQYVAQNSSNLTIKVCFHWPFLYVYRYCCFVMTSAVKYETRDVCKRL